MSARRLWYSILSLAAFLALFAAARADDEGGRAADVRVDEPRPLTDFLILAVKPEADEGNDATVEIGRTKIEPQPLGAVVKSLPFDFFGLRKQEYDEAAELAKCWAACRARAQCRDVAYERATAGRPVGVCRLKTYAVTERQFTPMAPVVEPGDMRAARLRAQREAARAAPARAGQSAQASAPLIAPETTRPPPKRPERPREEIPPPPRLAPAIAEYFPLPPRAVVAPAAPPAREAAPPRLPPVTVERFPLPARVVVEAAAPPAQPIEPAPPLVVETIAPPLPEQPPIAEPEVPTPQAVASGPPKSILTPQPPPQAAEAPPAPTDRKRGMPLWIAIGAVVLMLGGAALYWRNHRVRTLGRLTTRLVSDGLDGQAISIVGAEHRGLDLRFAVSASAAVNAPGTHIELIPKGAAA